MTRTLVLFAREPVREAREKGFASREAGDLFAEIARGWIRAARATGAVPVIASPLEDRPGWRRALGSASVSWIVQRGQAFGDRLERAARTFAALPGHTLIVGGDVAPNASQLDAAFRALEAGADAVIGPAADGGVSLIGLDPRDLDLLREIGTRRRDVLALLERRLAERERRVARVGLLPDVDGQFGVRALLRYGGLPREIAETARRALRRVPAAAPRVCIPVCLFATAPSDSRGPPPAA